ncbi:MAG TPA: NADH-quinone oxidoreductase subunit G [Egibacteraceae bacterium]|nr:NADH-quinone oxidoreductase subunit G [Egibacteraceae bacterium]
MVTLTIDGKEITVPKGTLVIRAAEQLGITIPRFCDHPLLDPVGACRQCMVEVEGQRKPFTSCTTTCTEGMVVRTHLTSEYAADAQEAQLEFLLINHPLDCPQCDKGGECPLQDQALAHGPSESRMVDEKRRYVKPVPISAQIALDRERCVLCARCTRFSQQIAGDPFIELFERGALEQVAIFADEPYHSYFSGNVAQICPVGALTATTYRFHARPFDLQTHPGVCNQCSAGCNLRIDVRRGEVQRQLARDNMAVNESWNCDKGRFGFEYVGHPDRLREPLVRDGLGQLQPAPWRYALQRAADGLRAAGEKVGVVTGARITDEDAYALSRFARGVLGTDNVDFRLAPRSADEQAVLAAVSGTEGPTYDDIERAKVIVLAGLDAEEEVPILHLRIRKAWRNHGARVVVVGPVLGSGHDYAARWVRTPAGDEAQVLRALAGDAGGDLPGDWADVADLLSGGGVVVLAGERLSRSPGALPAAAALAKARGGAFAWVPRRNNARGALDAGLMPGVLPGGRSVAEPGPVAEAWGTVPAAVGLDTREMLEAAARGELKALYLVGVDLVRDFEDPELALAALGQVDTVIVQDLLPNDTTRLADVILPATDSHERVGSFTNWEGRRQPFRQAVLPQGLAQEDWDIVRQLATVLGADLGWETPNDVRREAAPLMAAQGGALDRLPADLGARGTDSLTPSANDPADGASPLTDAHPLRAIALDYLIGEQTMLLGAGALKATSRIPSVWLNETDARRAGIGQDDQVRVTSAHGSAVLPADVRDTVAAGTVVLPGLGTLPAIADVLAGAPAGPFVAVGVERVGGPMPVVRDWVVGQAREGDA